MKMSNFRMPFELQKAVAAALGLDVNQLTRIVIDIGVEGPPRVRVSMYMTADQEDALIKVFEASEYREVANASTDAAIR
jgi:hypothetical protein